jgi:hypothetical protein
MMTAQNGSMDAGNGRGEQAMSNRKSDAEKWIKAGKREAFAAMEKWATDQVLFCSLAPSHSHLAGPYADTAVAARALSAGVDNPKHELDIMARYRAVKSGNGTNGQARI